MNQENKSQDYSMTIVISLLVGIIIISAIGFHSLYEEYHQERILRGRINDHIDDMNEIIYQDTSEIEARVSKLEELMGNGKRKR